MYGITKLGLDSHSFVSFMTQNAKGRSLLASMAVARVIANGQTLPSAPVESIEQYFLTQCRIGVESDVNCINEIILLDVKTVVDLVGKLYRLRYQAVHPSDAIFAFNKDTAVEDFFGITREFDRATLDALKEAPSELTMYVNKFRVMLSELKA